MSRTPVYIVCSTRPFVGKTLLARLLAEFLLLQRREVVAFDVNDKEPSLVDFLPTITETADVMDTFGKIQLMERLIVNDDIGKVLDLGFHAYDEFFKMIEEIGFIKEASRRGVDPILMFVADSDRQSGAYFARLRRTFPDAALVPVDNEQVLHGEPPASYDGLATLHIRALPPFLKTYIERRNFSFTGFLRQDTDSSSELNQWIRRNYIAFRDIELHLNRYRM
ncbi:hypothetical protein JQ557_09240 [Bradyrhizobium sp. U87765 SZCCT0131]|uniref:hypothetical protein n=1 Tax=unclassified Bradyrhizobium TaxID=2631580 RepID=UPI001BA48AA1|nr:MULTISPECIES: hypothetical protein [unclassified Bradyrhizobium]MBR1218169.1 hypothetical protein [Bradyrhizobium sp. U87765 SZCCT0131]MBR1260885.1 hypothetical protein [Bradyrhizobium sp. U87765 SZCCT0134]MBR1303667.1 hypothetical protein [Bradyrhizobium sp. U87765 SZCCT0110]MBR1319273.1 hypothetical protein [Bradyrhizobium sp. U87765 SZCCT0109]MBR1347598.1 hypothetical protein [Bradyrhizobium sp. U87765 SZCCT0048]